MARIAKLEALAREEIGKSGSKCVFVTVNGDIRAVFTGGLTTFKQQKILL